MALNGQEENIVNENIVDILTDKAREYYLSIICHRAIPDGRDGLTDIQRRIVWTCFENKWDKSKPHVKSAKVVGAVIADYHPHSNDSAYLTSAFLSQSWKEQIPLIEFHGSNGSISGSEPASMRYCVTGDTLISGKDFMLKPIEEIVTSGEKDYSGDYNLTKVRVKSFNGNLPSAIKGFDCGKHSTLKIKLDNGMRLECTPNHPLLSLNKENFTDLKWLLAGNIEVGENLLIKTNNNFPEFETDIFNYHKATLLGLILSPKCNIECSSKSNLIFRFDANNDFYNVVFDVFKRFLLSCDDSEDLEPTMWSNVTLMQQGGIDTITIGINNNDENFLSSIGYKNSHKFEIPKFILESEGVAIKVYFLRALFYNNLYLFDNDDETTENLNMLVYFSSSKKFIKQLQILLLEFGVLSTISKEINEYDEDDENCYKLKIVEPRSIYIVNSIIGRELILSFSNIDKIKETYDEGVKNLYTKTSISDRKLSKIILDYIHNDMNINLDNSVTKFDKIEDFQSYPDLLKSLPSVSITDYEEITYLIKMAYEYEIATVSKIKSSKNNVYSIRVNSDDHSFISNGFISHNTEQRLSKLTSELLTDELKSDSVDMKLNFNQDKKEPAILPAKVPFMLINGAYGIASGYISSIPTHNPREVILELLKKLKDKDYVADLSPDFPTGGIICNTAMIKEAYKDLPKAIANKKSKIIVRSKIEVDEKHNMLVITELPYMVSAESIVASIKNAIMPPKKNGVVVPPTITGISNIKNVTAKGVVRINIYCKKGNDLETIKNQLYRFTKCQASVPLSFVYCIGEKFMNDCKSVDSYIDSFIEFRKDTIKRIKTSIIRQKKFRINIIEGLFIILDENVIEEVFRKIRECKSRNEIHDMLMNDYGLNNIQAEKVSEYKLYQLASFAIEELRNEYDQLNEEIEAELEYFRNPEKFKEYMINEYEELLKKTFTEKKYPRRSVLENISVGGESQLIETIPDEDYVMIFTKKGYIKKLEMIKSQKRNTKGVSVGKLKTEDYVIGTTVLNSRDNILIFTENGKVYKYKVYEIPKCTTSTLGYFLSKDINNETIVNIIPITDEELESESLAFISASKYNRIKITNMSEYKNVKKSGIISMKLMEGIKINKKERVNDKVIGVEKINFETDDSIIALCSNGNAIRVNFERIPITSRTTYGAKLFATSVFNDGHTVKSISVVNNDSDYFLYISKKGIGKLMDLTAFDCQYRGTKGKIAAKLRDEDSAEKLITVKESDNLVVVSNKNLVKVKVNDFPLVKRVTYGNIIKKCTEDEFVIDIAIDKSI